MPELPEVETIVRALNVDIFGEKCLIRHNNHPRIQKIHTRIAKLREPIPDFSHVQNKEILAIRRRGKYILFEFDIGSIIIHLGMTGVLQWVDTNKSIEKHDHVDFLITLDDNKNNTNKENTKILRFSDPRRFGMVAWQEKNLEHKSLKKMGPEPLDGWSSEDLKHAIQTKKVFIKKLLMDNTIVVGVGNIYASEALHRAKIHPKTYGKDLTPKKIKLLHQSIIDVLNQGIEHGGATVKNYRHTDGEKGNMSSFLLVYGRAEKPCFACQTLISSEFISGRNTFWCPKCQKQTKN